jgi:hypothetical protein
MKISLRNLATVLGVGLFCLSMTAGADKSMSGDMKKDGMKHGEMESKQMEQEMMKEKQMDGQMEMDKQKDGMAMEKKPMKK